MVNDPAQAPPLWKATLYDAKHAFVWERAADLLPLLNPQPGERILDVGCGTGHLTARIAAAGAHVQGIDRSPDMIREARQNYPELAFGVADATDFHFEERFDAVFSNAALHWVRQPERVARCIHAALRPGGRFVAELGGKGNIPKLAAALRRARLALGLPLPENGGPWYFPSVGEYATVLESNGLEVTFATLFDRLTALDAGEAGLENWIRMFGWAFTDGFSAEKQAKLIRQVETELRAEFFRDGTWHADYRRLRVVAWKPDQTEAQAGT